MKFGVADGLLPVLGRGPRGPWGLKSVFVIVDHSLICRGPRGPWGLKFGVTVDYLMTGETSRPARALGVEIPSTFLITRLQIVEAREGLGG